MSIDYNRIRAHLADPRHLTTPTIPGAAMNVPVQDALDRLARWTRDANNLAAELDKNLTMTTQLSPNSEMLLLAARQARATNLADINRATEQVDDLRNQMTVLLSLARDVANQYAYAIARTNKRVVDQATL